MPRHKDEIGKHSTNMHRLPPSRCAQDLVKEAQEHRLQE